MASSLLDQATGAALLLPVQIPQGDATLALLERIAAAVEDTGQKSEQASEKTASGFDKAREGIRKAADTFNEVREAVTNLLGDVVALAEGMAAGADEAAALADRGRELGVDFDEAAESAGRFLDETSAMGAANQLAARGVNLTQQEMNALTRVAGATSAALRITTEEGVSRLTDALISGRGRALAPFGAELTAAAGNAHTMQERLDALVTSADRVTPATDNATDSVNRFKDSVEDAQREFAAGFVDGIREMDRLTVSTHDANEEATDLNTSIRAIGSTAAEVVAMVGNGVGAILGFIGTAAGTALASLSALAAASGQIGIGNVRGAGAAANAAFADSMTNGLAGTSFRFLQDRIATLEAIAGQDDTSRTSMAAPTVAPPRGTERARGTRGALGGSGGGGSEHHERRGADMTFSADEAMYGAEGLRLRREAVQRATELRERAAVDELIAEERRRQRHQAGSTLGDRIDAQREQRALARAQRNIDQRLAMEVSFTDRMEDMHSQRVNAAEMEAEFVTGAFNSLGQAMAKHIQLVVTGEETIGTALQGMLADTLTSIGQEAIVKGAMQIAEGLAALAGIVTAPLAPGHFAAGAAFIGVGALASAAGAALAPAPSVPSGGGGAASSAGRAAPVSKGDGGGDGSTVVNVMFGGPQYGTGGVRQSARELAGVLNRGAVQGGVRLNLRAATGAF